MPRFFQSITDLSADRESIRVRRYGVIDVVAGRLIAIHLRPWPKFISIAEILLLGSRSHERGSGDRCRLYYNQPWRASNYLTLKYALSTRDCSLRTMHAALAVLDEVARLKTSDAILCEVANSRLDDRTMQRYGWEGHCPGRWRRHFIKRFYGHYPAPRRSLESGDFAAISR